MKKIILPNFILTDQGFNYERSSQLVSPDFRKKMLKDGKRGYGGAIELGNDFFRRFVVPSK